MKKTPLHKNYLRIKGVYDNVLVWWYDRVCVSRAQAGIVAILVTGRPGTASLPAQPHWSLMLGYLGTTQNTVQWPLVGTWQPHAKHCLTCHLCSPYHCETPHDPCYIEAWYLWFCSEWLQQSDKNLLSDCLIKLIS